jgi:hypothetical protein
LDRFCIGRFDGVAAKVEKTRPFLSGPQLIARWGLDYLDHAQQVRFLQHLREKRLVKFRHLTLRHIIYDLESIIRLEEKNVTEARPDDWAPERKRRRRKSA